jgi:hypothetical protein
MDIAAAAANHCFLELKKIWRGFEAEESRIIPFCTPVLDRPRVVIVGMNHSVFLPRINPDQDMTAQEFSEAIPTRNAFIRKDFAPQRLSAFAEDMLYIFDQVGIEVTDAWMGTNRCPVQRTKLDEIRHLPSFDLRQKQTDVCLRALFKEIAPERIILVGKFAAELYFSGAEKKAFDDLVQPKKGDLRIGDQTTIFAIEYPNNMANRGVTNKARAIERLSKYWG